MEAEGRAVMDRPYTAYRGGVVSIDLRPRGIFFGQRSVWIKHGRLLNKPSVRPNPPDLQSLGRAGGRLVDEMHNVAIVRESVAA